MANVAQFTKCVICMEKSKIMIRLAEVLVNFQDLSVAEVLEELNFFPISNITNFNTKAVCCICLSKIYSCFEFKILCNQNHMLMLATNGEEVKCNMDVVEDNGNDEKKVNVVDVIDDPLAKVGKEVEKKSIRKPRTSKVHGKPSSQSQRGKKASAKVKPAKPQPETIRQGKRSKFASKSDITFTKAPQHTCPSCGVSFYRLNNLNTHLQTHKKSTQYICRFCQKIFLNSTELRQHEATHSNLLEYTCRFCINTFPNWTALRLHETTHPKPSKMISCNICQKVLSTEQKLKTHLRQHNYKTSKCRLCAKEFHFPSALKDLVIVHATGEEFSCNICTEIFAHNIELMQHEQTHSDKSFGCSICGMLFSSALQLKKHTQGQHKQKKIVCLQCTREFKRQRDLLAHSRIHTKVPVAKNNR